MFVRCLLSRWALCFWITWTSLHAEDPFTFAKTPGKLPKEIVPRHYRIRLDPDAAQLSTQGEVTAEVDVLQPTRKVVFNAMDLEISVAELDGIGIPLPTLDPKDQTATIELKQPLTQGKHSLFLKFRGKISRKAEGLFAEDYVQAGITKRMLGTQMEPSDARRMVPCWDEPAFRATFELTVHVPDGQVAVSNSAISNETKNPKGGRDVTFAPTPSMASYLLVLCMGELEFIEDQVDGVKLRIWTTKGKSTQARYALKATKRIVHFYNDYFGTKYPLPKLDQVAVPGGFGGAMENWGCITYNESILLFDPASSSQQTREAVFSVVAHEIAHQWFGNLVTMAWWDNLWLNEGFASWMGTKCTDHLNPSWQSWLREGTSKESVMGLDALKSTHPIQQPVNNEFEARDAFDMITYVKGQGFIRMLETYLGEREFRDGIRAYIARHAYGNTTTADLWSALTRSSGKPVAVMAEGWTTKPGFPVVSAESTSDGKLKLTQERFVASPDIPKEGLWQIPVSFGLSPRPGSGQFVLMTNQSLSVMGSSRGPVKLNLGNNGFYRVVYSPELAKSLASRWESFSAEDRLGMLGDAWAMVSAGRQDIATYLDLVSAMDARKTTLAEWTQVLGRLTFLNRLEKGTPGEVTFQHWAIGRLNAPMKRLGWRPRSLESPNDASLRSMMIEALGDLGDKETLRVAQARFEAFLKRPSSLVGDLRAPVLQIVGRYGDESAWNTLRALAQKSESTEEKNAYYAAFQGTLDTALAKKTLELALTEERPATQWIPIVGSVAVNHPDMAWEFTKTNADALLAKVPDFSRNLYLGPIAQASLDSNRAKELEALAASKLGTDGAAETAKAAEQLRQTANLKVSLVPALDHWIQTKAR